MAKCIYCNKREATSKEHYIPACFGMDKIKNFEELLNKVCPECNNKIGTLEEQFCRCGPEAFFKIIKGIKGRTKHEYVNPFYRGSSGGRPITITTRHPSRECIIYCETKEGDENPIPARQIIFVDHKGKFHSILITKNIQTNSDLRKELQNKGVNECEIVECWTPHEDKDWIERISKGFKAKFSWDTTTSMNVTGKKAFNIKFIIDDKYFRVIAKIGFHYFLKHFEQFSGFEKEFEGIKYFIMNGGNINNWVRQFKDSFISDLGSNVTTDKYAHFLVTEKQEDIILAKLMFFIGPRNFPTRHYQVFIGKSPGQIIYSQNVAHQITYYNQVDEDGYVGIMNSLRAITGELLP